MAAQALNSSAAGDSPGDFSCLFRQRVSTSTRFIRSTDFTNSTPNATHLFWPPACLTRRKSAQNKTPDRRTLKEILTYAVREISLQHHWIRPPAPSSGNPDLRPLPNQIGR